MNEWRPTVKQEEALLLFQEDDIFELLYGGARGGGKSEMGIASILYRKDSPRHRSLIIRKQAEDLKDWIDRARRFYEPFGAEVKGMPGDFYWPSGAITRTGHLKTEDAYSKYVGHEYDLIVIEELNLIPAEDNYLKLISSCRSVIPELKPKVVANCNPSDIGFFWIKKRWNISGIPQKNIFTTDDRSGLKRVFVPSRLSDNPHLAYDIQYKNFLDSLPDGLREAWRDGSWEDPIIKGAFYTYELAQAKRENRIGFLPYDPRLKVHTVWDLGIDDSMVIGFIQKTQREIRLINYYQNEGLGINHYIGKLQELQRQNRYIYGSHFAPHDVSKRELSTGHTILDTAKKLGLKFEVIPKVGVNDGILKTRLMFPRLFIHQDNCAQLIDALRSYRKEWDEELLKFSDKPIHDWSSHGADMVRYLSLVEDKMTNEEEENNYNPRDEVRNLDPYA